MNKWHKYIDDLIGFGFTTSKIGKQLGITAQAVRNYKKGISEPSHSTGEGIIKLHRDFIKRK